MHLSMFFKLLIIQDTSYYHKGILLSMLMHLSMCLKVLDNVAVYDSLIAVSEVKGAQI